MTNDELRDLLYRVGDVLRYHCRQTKEIVALIRETDAAMAAMAASEPDHIADAGKMIAAPRRLAPGETPREKGFYWATHKYTGDVTLIDARGIVFTCLSDFTDFYGPLTDPREARATLQTLHPQAASKSSDKPPENRENS